MFDEVETIDCGVAVFSVDSCADRQITLDSPLSQGKQGS
jgi:hypothetical protein